MQSRSVWYLRRSLSRLSPNRLKIYKAKSIVVDPVMVATSGSSLMKTDAVSTLMDELLPIADVVTPNIPEAEILSGMAVSDKEDMIKAAKKIGDTYECAVFLKGGHNIHDANDLLYANGNFKWFYGKRIDKSKHPWDGVYAVISHSIESCKGL